MSLPRRVVYLRDDAASRYDLAVQSSQHPMKPWRLTAVHALVRRLGLFSDPAALRVLTPPPIPADVMTDFHFEEYVDDLERTSGDSWAFAPASSHGNEWRPLTERGVQHTLQASKATADGGAPQNQDSAAGQDSAAAAAVQQQQQQGASAKHSGRGSGGVQAAPSCFTPHDCPVVQGGLEYSRLVAGASLFGAVLLNADAADTVINWMGGMHHARAGSCSGFCYVNDCVIAIRELLRKHRRVLYIDIDVHHGDGVEEAFYDRDDVFTLSLHKFCDGFFPGTGHPADVGVDRGRYFNMNVPLRDGVRDEEYVELFAAAFRGIAAAFRPEAIVLQCGADSLAGDRLGGTALRLSSEGHAACVRMVRDYCGADGGSAKKLLVLGGGGYSVRHLSRLWAYETAVLCGRDREIHSRMIVPLPQRSGVSGDASDRALPMWHLLELLKQSSVLAASDSGSTNNSNGKKSQDLSAAIQVELEERALMLVFADEMVSPVSAADSAFVPTCSLYVPSDGGGFEGRHQQGTVVGPGGLFRFVQTVVRQIDSHIAMLNDAMRARGF